MRRNLKQDKPDFAPSVLQLCDRAHVRSRNYQMPFSGLEVSNVPWKQLSQHLSGSDGAAPNPKGKYLFDDAMENCAITCESTLLARKLPAICVGSIFECTGLLSGHPVQLPDQEGDVYSIEVQPGGI
jgi:hypothetical protein